MDVLITERVSYLMSDDIPNCPEVHVLRPVVVEEDVPEYTRGYDNWICLGPIEGVDVSWIGKVPPAVTKVIHQLSFNYLSIDILLRVIQLSEFLKVPLLGPISETSYIEFVVVVR